MREDLARTNSCLGGLRSADAAMAVLLAERGGGGWVCAVGGDDEQLFCCRGLGFASVKGITHQVTTPTPETSLAVLLGQG